MTGGAVGSLDAIDGAELSDGDGAFVVTLTGCYIYFLDVDSAAAESSPDIISPDANAGDKRWIRQDFYMKLDNLQSPDDNTDLNASTTKHGLLLKLSNVATEYMNGQGAWSTPPDTNTGLLNIVEDVTPQLGGNLDANQKSIDWSTALSSDHTAAGDIKTHTAGENLVFGNFCYLKAADSKIWKTDANAEATCSQEVVIALESIDADATGSFLHWGWARDDSWAWVDEGDPLFFSAAATGAVTETAPAGAADIIRIAGYIESATVIKFDPDQTYIEHT